MSLSFSRPTAVEHRPNKLAVLLASLTRRNTVLASKARLGPLSSVVEAVAVSTTCKFLHTKMFTVDTNASVRAFYVLPSAIL